MEVVIKEPSISTSICSRWISFCSIFVDTGNCFLPKRNARNLKSEIFALILPEFRKCFENRRVISALRVM